MIDECRNEFWVELSASTFSNLGQCEEFWSTAVIRATRRNRIPCIDDCNDAGSLWDVASSNALGIATTIPPLMMCLSNFDDFCVESSCGEQVGAVGCVALDAGVLRI
jgi:hypothetical protein